MRKMFLFWLVFSTLACSAQDEVLQLVFTSDVHYGIYKNHFRGADSVPSTVVNRAMIGAINRLPGVTLPQDGGAGAGVAIGAIDGLLITGDIANREEAGVQSAAVSWKQFEADYDHLLKITDRNHAPTPVLLSPGNHDVSNAIGYSKPMHPLRDASSMAGMYNRMMGPATLVTAATYDYSRDKIHFMKDFGGVALAFLNCWPDSMERAWLGVRLRSLRAGEPVLLFTHANPDVEARFFTNPHSGHAIDTTHKFENLLAEVFQDGMSAKDTAWIEQRGFVTFLQHHPEIKAYFHGHNNWTEYYTWQGPDANIALPCFRVDSPMKGKVSAKDETQLSFEVITIDVKRGLMTVRECRWNTVPQDASVLQWGQTKTVSLAN